MRKKLKKKSIKRIQRKQRKGSGTQKKSYQDELPKMEMTKKTLPSPVKSRLVDKENVEFQIGRLLRTTTPLKTLPVPIICTFSDEINSKMKMVKYDEPNNSLTYGLINPISVGGHYSSLMDMLNGVHTSFVNNEMVVHEFLCKYGVLCRELGYLVMECWKWSKDYDENEKGTISSPLPSLLKVPVFDHRHLIGDNEVEITQKEVEEMVGHTIETSLDNYPYFTDKSMGVS
jgi:hypothetical protein